MKRTQTRPHRRANRTTILFALATLAGCGATDSEWREFEADSRAFEGVPSWEEFLASSTFTSPDGPRYMVEDDIPVLSVEALRAYYEHRYLGELDKLAVRTFGGGDDAWFNDDQRRLEYCVSTSFPSSGTWSRAAVLAGMVTAATRWQQQGNVMFTYIPSQDATCDLSDTPPHTRFIKVTPVSIAGAVACAFYPSSRFTCPELEPGDTLGIDTADTPPISVARTLTHELGHHLGMVHEYQRADTPGGACPSADSSRYLTNWDVGSIMHASAGGCGSSPTENLTATDGLGIRALYGAPAGWFPAYSLITG